MARSRLSSRDDLYPTDYLFRFLIEKNLVPFPQGSDEGFDEYRDLLYEHYDHGPFWSSIHPEDERLLYNVSAAFKSRSAFIAGSYYGYFAIWAMKGIAERGGTCTLSDVNPRVCDLARENFSRLGFGDHTRVCCEDAVSLFSKRKEPIDLLLLDAVGAWNDPRPEYRGKVIYYPILQGAIPLLEKGSVVVMHNMRPNYFPQLIDLLESIGGVGLCCDSHNGLGLYVIS
ncbi:MAG: class I SAM-dependent methyltransferase [Treponema sp.]|nr:class I SAM-dependent methyltransferase [Treponema sp.]